MCQELRRSLDQEFRSSGIWNGRYGREDMKYEVKVVKSYVKSQDFRIL
jgi:hypothetical protein